MKNFATSFAKSSLRRKCYTPSAERLWIDCSSCCCHLLKSSVKKAEKLPCFVSSTATDKLSQIVHCRGRGILWRPPAQHICILYRCASGCVIECRICNREVAGSNLSLGYFAPRSTQPSTPPGSANEYQLRLGKAKGRYGSFRLRMNVWVCR